MMLHEIGLWTQKLRQGHALALETLTHHALNRYQSIEKIAFVGMGGSGIAGRILQSMMHRQSTVPIMVIDSCEIPRWVDSSTFAIVISYSGNTWETLAAYDQLMSKNIPTLALSHGGTLREKALHDNIPFAQLPASLTPRSSLGVTLGFLMHLMNSFQLVNGDKIFDLWLKCSDKLIEFYQKDSAIEPFIYAVDHRSLFSLWGVAGYTDAVAYRAQTQFNENSKLLITATTFPELCHNYLVGFSALDHSPLVITLSVKEMHESLRRALNATEQLLEERGVSLYKPPLLGDTFEEQVLSLIVWADYASYHLARVRGVDAQQVRIIEDLKQRHKQQLI